jgi:putative ABC transport system permease protein
VEPLERTISGSVAQERFTTLLLTLFAVLAIALAAIGVYGLLSFVVAQRTAELGIRLALGAEPAGLMRMIVAHAARLALVGVALGGIGAVAGAQLMRSLLFGVSAADPRALATAAAATFLVALLASLGPARRAVGADPLRALRVE